MKSLFKSYYFWITFIAISVLCCVGIKRYFSQAFPFVNLNLTMDRAQALEKASALATQHHWLPTPYNQVATFQTDSDVQTFVELAAGGVSAFTAMMDNNLYMPYYWEVRHYAEQDKHETHIHFTPSGTPYGFEQIIAETDAGAHLTVQEARAIAERDSKEWGVNLADYELIETSSEVALNNRTDYTFQYQRTKEKIGEGFYRLKLEVSGDKLTALLHSVKIPESFTLHYRELRSTNTSIASAATIATFLLYVIGGLITLLFFMKSDFFNSTGFLAALVVALLALLSRLSQLPLIWEHYPTALGSSTFLLNSLLYIASSFMMNLGLYTFAFCVAEALTRKAFSSHIQLWKVWDTAAASSWQIWGRTIAGYLIVPLHLLFAIIIYIIAEKYLGWWNPASTLTDPNILAEYAPWISAFSNSLSAGFMEECLFRAIPLASAALWGRRYGYEKACVAIAFVLQIIIFGAAHANYPTQPAYARIIELIVPSSIFGGLYLAFGLIPSIISHVIYDVFWFALPLFISQAPGAWLYQLLVIALSATPLLIILVARLRSKSWTKLPASFYNSAYREKTKKVTEVTEEVQTIVHKKIGFPLFASALLGTGLIGFWLYTEKNQAPVVNISRTQAIKYAREILAEQGVVLEQPWQPLNTIGISIENFPAEHNYIWETAESVYTKLLNSYLRPPHWYVRFVRFSGSCQERAEQYYVFVDGNGKLLRTLHVLPEDAPGKTLSKEDARTIAIKNIAHMYNLSGGQLKEISAEETKQPQRKDWVFTFADTTFPQLIKDEARIAITIAGDQITDSKRFIYVPEQWQREYQNKSTYIAIIRQIAGMAKFLILLVCFILFTFLYANRISIRKAFGYFVLIFGIYLAGLLNGMPSLTAYFNTAAPFINQLFTIIGASLLNNLVIAALITFVLMLLMKSYRAHTSKKSFNVWLIGVCAGLLISGIGLSTTLVTYSAKPLWAQYSALGAYIPYGLITDTFVSWLTMSLMLTMLIYGLEYISPRLYYPKITQALIFVCCFVLWSTMSLEATTPLLFWFVGRIAGGTALWFVYEWWLSFDYALLATVVGVYQSALLLQQAWFAPYPLALLTAPCGIAIIMASSWYWFIIVNRKKSS